LREIILDTETTGLDPVRGDRIVEIGCVEVFNLIPTGQVFHCYLDPQRDMPEEAFRVHGLSREFLTGKPTFDQIVDDFLSFIGDDRLVIHNAEFDMKFINHELKMIKRQPILMDRVLDTLALARKKHPGSSNSLDALCARYKIDNSRRTKHGALLDGEILAEVYAELCGGRQTALSLQAAEKVVVQEIETQVGARTHALLTKLSEDEMALHSKLVEKMGTKAIWNYYIKEDH